MAHSLRSRLLAWVVLPLAGAVLLDGWITRLDADATAGVIHDRLLLGSARMVAEQLRFEDGSVRARIPPAALELFQSNDFDRVFYRVIGRDGRTVTGYDDLALADVALQPETPRFADAVVRGQPVRAVAYLQPVLTDAGLQPVRVEIAQTLQGRDQLAHHLWFRAMGQQVAILALVVLLVLVGLRSCLRPLLRLRDEVLQRRPDMLHALETRSVPAELAPLAEAFNDYARRLAHHMGLQQVFLQNAAHQLRTPLTLLTTQVSYALRTNDAAVRTESLEAIRATLGGATRLVNQLLALSSAEAHAEREMNERSTDLDAVVREVLEDLSGRAQARAIDLGFERTAQRCTVNGHALTLREIAMNLVDNAIRYTPSGGVVTCRLSRDGAAVVLTVEDDGPGIPASERARVFERFYRIHDADSDGCGLGLSIVKEFAAGVGAAVTLRDPAGGRGLAVDVSFPRAGD